MTRETTAVDKHVALWGMPTCSSDYARTRFACGLAVPVPHRSFKC